MSDLFNETDRSGKGVVPGLGRRAPDRSERTKRVHAAFGFVGLLVAIAAAIFAYNETSSIALPIFVFIFVQAYIGRGLGEVATDPEKGKRFVYFTLQPIAAFGWELRMATASDAVLGSRVHLNSSAGGRPSSAAACSRL